MRAAGCSWGAYAARASRKVKRQQQHGSNKQADTAGLKFQLKPTNKITMKFQFQEKHYRFRITQKKRTGNNREIAKRMSSFPEKSPEILKTILEGAK